MIASGGRCVSCILLTIFTFKVINAQKNCWNSWNDSCLVKIEIINHANPTNYDRSHIMEIDCSPLQGSDREEISAHMDRSQKMTSQRSIDIQSIILDGCRTPLNTHSYGLEYVPACSNITEIVIKNFHMDFIRQLHCVSAIPLQMKALRFVNNEIAVADQNSFESYDLLEALEIAHNSLRSLHPKSLQNLQCLTALRIVDEPVLIIKSSELIQSTKVTNLHIESIKQLTADIFHSLPEALTNIYIADTVIDSDAIQVINDGSLNNLTIVNCFLQSVSVNDAAASIECINLSDNNLENFEISTNNLRTLDLSNNRLETLPLKWLTNLDSLHDLILKGNHIKVLLFYEILQYLPQVRRLDIRANRMQSLHNIDHEFNELTLFRVQVLSDRNPWDCLWLHSFAHNYPEVFRTLRYDKFISKINVNGLECIPSERRQTVNEPIMQSNATSITTSTTTVSTSASPSTSDQVVNVSAYTIIYGNPWEFKRNQRAEALIIVFMLPLGIALLFLLLYLWIYCQKVFHLSYYQNFNCRRRPEQSVLNSGHEFNSLHLTVSDPSLTVCNQTNDNYEEPIKLDVPSICNCNQIGNGGNCQRNLQLIYESFPKERPQQIYEQIIDVEDEFSEKRA
ncbi:hypothetical protein GQX74_002337 [Glossina fuscipes]|nr:hypothetical protein GQX74_002337 [Glossina fuscipes]